MTNPTPPLSVPPDSSYIFDLTGSEYPMHFTPPDGIEVDIPARKITRIQFETEKVTATPWHNVDLDLTSILRKCGYCNKRPAQTDHWPRTELCLFPTCSLRAWWAINYIQHRLSGLGRMASLRTMWREEIRP